MRTAVGSVSGGTLLVVVVFSGIIASYSDYIPYWDAWGYFDCVTDAVQKPFSLLNFRCVTHPSMAYLFVLGLTQYLAPLNVHAAYAGNALLGVASIVAFHGLVRLIVPKRPSVEYSLVTALYAFAPLFLVHALFFNLDYGATAFFVLFLAFLVARRFWTASVFAVAMMFSKEVGAAAFVAAVAAYVVAFTIRAPLSWKERVACLGQQAPLMAAPLILAAYVVDFHTLQPNPGSWISAYVPVSLVTDRLALILNMNPADASFRAYLADVFVLNFQWIYTGVLVAAACAAVGRLARSGKKRVALAGSELFLGLLLIELVYIVTRFRTYNNARYVLIASPVLIVAFYRALVSVLTNGAARRVFLSVTAALVLLSNFRTLDAGSKAVFGTFKFGSHAVLDMPALMKGPRLDSLVYNLESLQFHYLLSDMMRDWRPAQRTVLFMGDTRYAFPSPIDERSYTPTVDPSHAIQFYILSMDWEVQRDVLRSHGLADGDPFVYLALANADNHQLRLLRAQYPLVGAKQYDRNGYTLDLYTFRFTSMP